MTTSRVAPLTRRDPARTEGVWPALDGRSGIAHSVRDRPAGPDLVAACRDVITVPLPAVPFDARIVTVRGKPSGRALPARSDP